MPTVPKGKQNTSGVRARAGLLTGTMAASLAGQQPRNCPGLAPAWSRAEPSQPMPSAAVRRIHYDVQGRAPRRRNSPKLEEEQTLPIGQKAKRQTSRSVPLTVRERVVRGCRFGLLFLLPCFTRRNSSSSCIVRSVHCFGISLPDFF